MESTKTYEELLAEVTKLQREGRLPTRPDREQMIDWAYGNTKIENEDVTKEITTVAVDTAFGDRF